MNHGRIGTACSKQWHTGPAGVGATEAGTPNRRQGQRENLWRSHTARIWANVRAPVRFGPPRTACSKQWHTVSGPAQPSRGTRVPVRAAGKSTVPEPSATAAEPFSTLRLGAGTTTLPLSSSVKGPDPPSLSVKESVPEWTAQATASSWIVTWVKSPAATLDGKLPPG